MSALSELWGKIKFLLTDLWVDFWPLLKIMLTEQGRLALAAAKNVVLNVQNTMPDATGQEKPPAALPH